DVSLDAHAAPACASRLSSTHAAMSRWSQTRRRPTLIAGGKRPSWRSHRTVSTGTRRNSATSSMVQSTAALLSAFLFGEAAKVEVPSRPRLDVADLWGRRLLIGVLHNFARLWETRGREVQCQSRPRVVLGRPCACGRRG